MIKLTAYETYSQNVETTIESCINRKMKCCVKHEDTHESVSIRQLRYTLEDIDTVYFKCF